MAVHQRNGVPALRTVSIGCNKNIGQFVVRHAGAGGEDPSWNTRDFSIRVSTNATTWTTVANVTANTANVTVHSIPTTSARYVQLLITNPQTNPSFVAARIYEFEVYSPTVPAPTETPTPPPATTPP